MNNSDSCFHLKVEPGECFAAEREVANKFTPENVTYKKLIAALEMKRKELAAGVDGKLKLIAAGVGGKLKLIAAMEIIMERTEMAAGRGW
jgi:hypothetical protein